MVLQRGNGIPFSPAGLLLFLSGIGCAYSWDRLWDAPLACRARVRRLLLAGVVVSAAIGALALWRLPLSAFEMVLLLGGVTLAYPWLKRVPLLKNLIVAVVWVVAAAVFPFQHSEALSWGGEWPDVALPLWVLWVAACLLCDLKDEEEDRAATVRSVPTLFGTRAACGIAALLAAASGSLALWQGRAGIATASLLLMMLAGFPRLLKRKALGPLIVDAVLVVPGLLLFWEWV